jgi:hypothetical protein
MRRLIVLLSLLVLPGIACTFNVQMQPQAEKQTVIPSLSPVPTTEADISGDARILEGPNINYNGIRFTLDPALSARLYVFDDVTTIDGLTAHHTRFALILEEYCQTWCLMVYPVAEFEQAFGTFVFPPAGYRGGAGVVFRAQEIALSFQNGSGDRSVETFGQDHYGVSNESLNYVFRGYSADGQYGVFAQIPIGATSLPDTAPTMTTDAQNILEYNRRAAESINGLTPADFTPNLGLLDALVASIHVETP